MELSHTRGIAQAPSNILLHVMRHHPLFFYFLIAYAVTWSVGFLFIVLLHHPPTLGLFLTMIAGPTISAFIMTAATEGKAGVSRLLRRYVLWRVGVPWYLLVLIATPVLLLLSILILPGGTAIVRSLVVNYPLSYLVTMFLGGPFFEEPGWRGFALPRLQQHIGPVRGSLLLGVLWTFWHLPVFFIPGFNGAGVGLGGISTAVLALASLLRALCTRDRTSHSRRSERAGARSSRQIGLIASCATWMDESLYQVARDPGLSCCMFRERTLVPCLLLPQLNRYRQMACLIAHLVRAEDYSSSLPSCFRSRFFLTQPPLSPTISPGCLH